jgi:glutathione S-transferase
MITLYGFGPGLDQPDFSPFVMKAMILLRMAGLPFVMATGMAAMRVAPYGKLPYIRDGNTVVADTRQIRRHLETVRGADFSGGYDAERLALGHAVERMLEESSYFAVLHRRWVRPDGWQVMRATVFGGLPAPLRLVVPPIARRAITRALRGQGTGRLPDAEIDAIAASDFTALSALLGERPFLLGDRPCASDATMLAFLVAGLARDFPGPMFDALARHDNLVAYRDRLSVEFLPQRQGTTIADDRASMNGEAAT